MKLKNTLQEKNITKDNMQRKIVISVYAGKNSKVVTNKIEYKK